jgi:hypothetical protein
MATPLAECFVISSVKWESKTQSMALEIFPTGIASVIDVRRCVFFE